MARHLAIPRRVFQNAQGIGDRLWPLIDEMKPSVVLLDGSALIDLEYTAHKMLTDGEERLRRQGGTVWITSLNADVLTVVQQSPLGRTLGRDRMFFDLQRAVQHYERTAASPPRRTGLAPWRTIQHAAARRGRD